MMNFTFKTSNGKTYTVSAKDADRARSAAKKAALNDGSEWKAAKLIKISNAL